MRPSRSQFALLAATFVAVLAVASPSALAGNSGNAKTCQKGGWQTVLRPDLTPFTSEEGCTSWGAQGGSYVTPSFVMQRRTYDPGTDLCFSSSPCHGFALDGTGLLPGSPVIIHIQNPNGSDFVGYYLNAAEDGTFFIRGTLACGFFLNGYATGTTAFGNPRISCWR